MSIGFAKVAFHLGHNLMQSHQILMLVFTGCSNQALQCTVVCWWVDDGWATGELYFCH